MISPFDYALDQYAGQGVDVNAALEIAGRTPISVHCWQGDDVGGFETAARSLEGSGLQTTGGYPGRARTIEELQADLSSLLKLLPGTHRLNLHACYGDFRDHPADRDAISFVQFEGWVEWAKKEKIGIDFNPTYFGHPLAQNGTLSSADASTRSFWIQHGVQCRKIAAEIAAALDSPSVCNVWIPDGSKDLPVDRSGPRARLRESLDAIFAVDVDERLCLDAVESKLFGIGSESYVVGSHEFYLGYAARNQKMLCLDAGHFHPTESMADKISSVLEFIPGVLLHVSRGVRWDSDHVVLSDDATRAVFEEIVRGDFLDRVYIGLDFFDPSINRIAAWAIGTLAARKCLLQGLLEPTAKLRAMEAAGDFAGRLALLEASKSLPFGIVWDEFCNREEAPGNFKWMDEVRKYERETLAARG